MVQLTPDPKVQYGVTVGVRAKPVIQFIDPVFAQDVIMFPLDRIKTGSDKFEGELVCWCILQGQGPGIGIKPVPFLPLIIYLQVQRILEGAKICIP